MYNAPGSATRDTLTVTAVDNDNESDSGTGQVELTVAGVPVANAATYTVSAGDTLSVTTTGAGVLAYATDPNELTMTAELVSGPSLAPCASRPNGTFTYKPTGTQSATDTFEYEVTDGLATSAPAEVTIEIEAAGTPVGVEDEASGCGYCLNGCEGSVANGAALGANCCDGQNGICAM